MAKALQLANANPSQTPISELTLAQVISLTQAGLIGLQDGAPVYTDKADRAAKAGATYVSPFIGRIDDISSDGLQLISEIRLIFDNYNYKTEILSASIRGPMHIIDCAKIGSDVVTTPLKSIKSLLNHPLTDIGLKKFLDDYNKGNK